jgi:hypothetical protein
MQRVRQSLWAREKGGRRVTSPRREEGENGGRKQGFDERKDPPPGDIAAPHSPPPMPSLRQGVGGRPIFGESPRCRLTCEVAQRLRSHFFAGPHRRRPRSGLARAFALDEHRASLFGRPDGLIHGRRRVVAAGAADGEALLVVSARTGVLGQLAALMPVTGARHLEPTRLAFRTIHGDDGRLRRSASGKKKEPGKKATHQPLPIFCLFANMSTARAGSLCHENGEKR